MNRLTWILLFVATFTTALFLSVEIENRHLQTQNDRLLTAGDKAILLLTRYETALRKCIDNQDAYQLQTKALVCP